MNNTVMKPPLRSPVRPVTAEDRPTDVAARGFVPKAAGGPVRPPRSIPKQAGGVTAKPRET